MKEKKNKAETGACDLFIVQYSTAFTISMATSVSHLHVLKINAEVVL